MKVQQFRAIFPCIEETVDTETFSAVFASYEFSPARSVYTRMRHIWNVELYAVLTNVCGRFVRESANIITRQSYFGRFFGFAKEVRREWLSWREKSETMYIYTYSMARESIELIARVRNSLDIAHKW